MGDDYYLATSSFEYFPGAPIFHSIDLVSWRQIGNILTTREQFVEGEGRPSGGIYGSTLRHHGGLFYFITTNVSDFDAGQVIVTAADPAGPWSAPVRVPEAVGIDPDLAWDEDGTCLITWHDLDFTVGGKGIRQAPLDPTTGRLLGPAYDVWQGSGLPAAEGPHLYRIGDWWYLMLAEGGTERGHCVTVARAPRPNGPYEACPANPVFTRRSTVAPVQSTGHADLVQASDGTWAAVYLGTRPRGSTPGFHLLGRETFLAGIEWRDGWPVFDPDRFELPAGAHSFVDAFPDELDPRWVVPSGDLETVGHRPAGGVTVPAGARLCTRVTDLAWQADAVVAGSGGLEVRIDPRHRYGMEIVDGRVRAYAVIGDLRSELGSAQVPPGQVTLRLVARDPGRPGVPQGDAGPDEIVLSAIADDSVVELAALDGRYLSTEVASGFTGRMLALGADAFETSVLSFVYAPTT